MFYVCDGNVIFVDTVVDTLFLRFRAKDPFKVLTSTKKTIKHLKKGDHFERSYSSGYCEKRVLTHKNCFGG